MTNKTNTPSEQQKHLMATWLNEYHSPSVIRDYRKAIARFIFDERGASKFTDLRPDIADAVLVAIGAKRNRTLTVPVNKMERMPKVEPIFGEPKVMNVTNVTNRMTATPEEIEASDLRREPIQTLGSGKISPLEAKRRELLQKRLEKEQAELKADFDGRAWTVQAAYKPHMVFLFIKQGIHKSEDDIESLRSQHVDAHMYLEPEVLIGNLGEVRTQATKLFTGQGDGDVLVRIVKKEST